MDTIDQAERYRSTSITLIEKAIVKHCYGLDVEAAALLAAAECFDAPVDLVTALKGMFLSANGDHEKAVEYAEQAREVRLPASIDTYRRRCWAESLIHLGQAARARTVLREGVRRDG